jgi:hypothetical protein
LILSPGSIDRVPATFSDFDRVLYALHETRDVEGVGIMLDLARETMGCFVTDEVVGEGISDCKGGDAVAEERGDDKAGVHGSG